MAQLEFRPLTKDELRRFFEPAPPEEMLKKELLKKVPRVTRLDFHAMVAGKQLLPDLRRRLRKRKFTLTQLLNSNELMPSQLQRYYTGLKMTSNEKYIFTEDVLANAWRFMKK